MEYKKVDVELLEKLQKATQEYKAMAGALIGESKETMGEEVYYCVLACRDDYEMEMFRLIDEITGTLNS